MRLEKKMLREMRFYTDEFVGVLPAWTGNGFDRHATTLGRLAGNLSGINFKLIIGEN